MPALLPGPIGCSIFAVAVQVGALCSRRIVASFSAQTSKPNYMEKKTTLQRMLTLALAAFTWLFMMPGGAWAQVDCVDPGPGVDTESEAYLIVILVDEFCCTDEWDDLCQDRYNVLTGVPCTAPPGSGVDPASEAYFITLVLDPDCCYDQWDADCTELYQQIIIANVDEIQGEQRAWAIFPNPTDGNFTISYEGESGNALVEVIDAQGRIVHSGREVLLNGSLVRLDLANRLNAGAYIVRLTTDQGRQESRMVVH